MKKLFLLLAFVGVSAFAGSNDKNAMVLEEDVTCVPVTLSCGISGYSCGETTAEIIRYAINADNEICNNE